MKQRSLMLFVALVIVLMSAGVSPVAAGDFSLYGSYWDTDVAGDAGGGGISLGLPLGDVFAFELRGTYYEELTDDPLENIFDSDDPVFEDRSIQVLPIEAGVRFTFAHGGHFRPHLGGGVSYFLLDSDFGEISDEVGWYAAAGATIGDGQGAEFFFEGIWREATATVEIDPEDFEDIDDIEVDHHESFDMGGIGVNAGVRWTF
jgi:hypothetical protein